MKRVAMFVWAVGLVATMTGCPSEDDSDSNGFPIDEDSGSTGSDTGHTDSGRDTSGGSDTTSDASGGSDGETTDGSSDYDTSGCEPSHEAWMRHAKPHVERYCADCHGETPQFGAPFSLLSYDELVAGQAPERKVDLMAEQLLAGTMPPAGNPRPEHTALDTLVEWATCGQKHADHSDGLTANRPVWKAPDEPPAAAESFEVLADDFEVGLDVIDRYQCFTIDAPIDEPRLVRRIEPVIDDSRVLHHSILALDKGGDDASGTFQCTGFPPGDSYLFAWGPGQAGYQFDEGGIRIEPGDRFVLQIHYNNGAGAENVSDSSGVRVYHEPTGGPEFYMRDTGPTFFAIPPGETISATGTCTMEQEANLIASWPHMHEIGSEFETVLIRENGERESVISLTGWSFEAQLIYETPMTLQPGDKLETTCTFTSDRDQITTFGPGTKDEMCFNFMIADQPICSGL